jgi:hypothetical protein
VNFSEAKEPMNGDNRVPVLAEEIKRAHAGVYDAAKTAAERAIEAGRALLEAKSLVKHGEWLSWLKQHCELPERTAQFYMHIAKLGLDSATVVDLGLKGAAKAIVLQYPYPNPFEDGPEEVQREWHVFLLMGVRAGMACEGAYHYCEWLVRVGWESPSAWLTEEGDRYCECRGMTGRPSQSRAEWLCLLDEYRERPLSDIKAEIKQTETNWQERVAAGHAVVIKPPKPRKRHKARSTLR